MVALYQFFTLRLRSLGDVFSAVAKFTPAPANPTVRSRS